MDEKFSRRFTSFQNSLSSLREARERDLNDPFVLSGTGAKFSITFDLAWKVMKDIIIQKFEVVDFPKGSPREVLRKAWELDMISSDIWLTMLRNRNDLTHDYDGELLAEICQDITGNYIALFDEFEKWVLEKATPF